jgi:hypothetical protein
VQNQQMDNGIQRLDRQSRNVTLYLIVAATLGFFLGYYFLALTNRMVFVLAVALIGFSGSSVAALTSCLDRYANGFEREDGTKEPKEAKGETFNRRMARWFYVRPFLGLVVAPLFLWGIEFFVKDPSPFRDSPQHIAFSAFLGGLLAKSVLDLIKNLFKNVFRV